jgi:hypothetical protein
MVVIMLAHYPRFRLMWPWSGILIPSFIIPTLSLYLWSHPSDHVRRPRVRNGQSFPDRPSIRSTAGQLAERTYASASRVSWRFRFKTMCVENIFRMHPAYFTMTCLLSPARFGSEGFRLPPYTLHLRSLAHIFLSPLHCQHIQLIRPTFV